jgi:hypothetical protein
MKKTIKEFPPNSKGRWNSPLFFWDMDLHRNNPGIDVIKGSPIAVGCSVHRLPIGGFSALFCGNRVS